MCKDLDPTYSKGALGGGLQKFGDAITGESAADATKEAAETAAAAEMERLEYLKETEALPQAFREGGLTQLGALSGFSFDPETGQATYTGDMSAQQGLIDQSKLSPLYQSIMGGRAAGEEALARSNSAVGGLRGGSTAADLVSYNTDLQNNALLQAYNQQLGGIQGLAGLPSNANQIGQSMSNIGQIQAQGIQGSAQARQNAFNNLLNVGGQAGAAYLSDYRLKDNIAKTGTTGHPAIDTYSWVWKEESGKQGSDNGYIAQEVETVWPDLVIIGEDGYKRILKEELEQRLKELN